jgi:NAD(P)-dependent dehydrogenase (short-subunit alcohol dehydrogenase family)
LNLAECRPLITGAGRGIGRAFVTEFLEAGAPRIYAAARTDAACAELAALDPRVTPLRLDTRDSGQVSAAAKAARDANVLVNNAGVERTVTFLGAPSMDDARAEMETNYFGALAMCRAFAPRLVEARGAIVNILSIAAVAVVPHLGSYSASKAAARALTHGVRAELGPHGVRVIAVYAGPYETDMSWHVPEVDAGMKHPPRMLTSAVRAALSEGEPDEIYPDPIAQAVHRAAQRDMDALIKASTSRIYVSNKS